MDIQNVNWVLVNHPGWSLAKHVKRFSKLLLRNMPGEFAVEKANYHYLNDRLDVYDINRRLDILQRKDLCRYLKTNQATLEHFSIQFVSYSDSQNNRFTLSGTAPFERLELVGENVPTWLREVINRKFKAEIGFSHKLWSFFHNRRLFKYSLSR